MLTEEAEFNPVLVNKDKAIVADCRVIISQDAMPQRTGLAEGGLL